MTAVQMGLTIAVCTAATMLTRFLPFVVFSSKDQQPPEVVRLSLIHISEPTRP